MPRTDRTFSVEDIVRIIENHLDRAEQLELLHIIQVGDDLEEEFEAVLRFVRRVHNDLGTLGRMIDIGLEAALQIVPLLQNNPLGIDNLDFITMIQRSVRSQRDTLENIDF